MGVCVREGSCRGFFFVPDLYLGVYDFMIQMIFVTRSTGLHYITIELLFNHIDGNVVNQMGRRWFYVSGLRFISVCPLTICF